MTEISAVAAFGAGLLSFLSPCVFPLIPSWLLVVGGMGPRSAASGEPSAAPRLRVVACTGFFTLGFSAVFVAGSIVLSGLVIASGLRYMDIAAGIIVILLGLNVLFDFLRFLNYEKRFHVKGSPGGFAGAFLAGAAFGAGWTPCVGPVLTSILLLAGQSGSIVRAALYLALYSAGLALPFLAAAFFFDRFAPASARLRRHLPLIQRVSGALLVLIGALILSGRFRALAQFAARIALEFV
jgi:cytochrome c-type biogenesis protein